jgi:hypothetical protein
MNQGDNEGLARFRAAQIRKEALAKKVGLPSMPPQRPAREEPAYRRRFFKKWGRRSTVAVPASIERDAPKKRPYTAAERAARQRKSASRRWRAMTASERNAYNRKARLRRWRKWDADFLREIAAEGGSDGADATMILAERAAVAASGELTKAPEPT